MPALWAHSSWKADTGRLWVLDHPGLHRKFQANLGYKAKQAISPLKDLIITHNHTVRKVAVNPRPSHLKLRDRPQWCCCKVEEKSRRPGLALRQQPPQAVLLSWKLTAALGQTILSYRPRCEAKGQGRKLMQPTPYSLPVSWVLKTVQDLKVFQKRKVNILKYGQNM